MRAWNRTDVPDFYQSKQHVLQATHFSVTNTFQVKRWDNSAMYITDKRFRKRFTSKLII